MALNNYFAPAKGSVYRVIKDPTTGQTKNYLVDPSKYDALNVPNALRPKTTTTATAGTSALKPASPIPTLGYLTSRVDAIKAPTYQAFTPTEFQKPTFSFSTDEQLGQKAGSQLSPAFQAALNRLRESNGQRVRSAGESLIGGGMMDTGYSKAALAQENALSDRNVADVEMGQAAQLAQLIDQLKQREMQQADTEYDRIYRLWSDQNQMGLNAVNMANDVAYKGYQGQLEPLNLLSGLASQGIQGQQWQRTFDQNTAQAAAQKEQWNKDYGLKQRQVDYETGKPYYNPNSGGGGGLTPTQARNAGYAQNFDAAAQSLLNYKSFNDMLADVQRMTPEQKEMLGPGGWNKLFSYANSGAVKGQYFDQYKDPLTPSGFVPGGSSPLRSTVGGTATTSSVRSTSPAKATTTATTKPAQAKSSGTYSQAISQVNSVIKTKSKTKQEALQWAASNKSEFNPAEYNNLVKYINSKMK